jgi:hypothetical protein
VWISQRAAIKRIGQLAGSTDGLPAARSISRLPISQIIISSKNHPSTSISPLVSSLIKFGFLKIQFLKNKMCVPRKNGRIGCN